MPGSNVICNSRDAGMDPAPTRCAGATLTDLLFSLVAIDRSIFPACSWAKSSSTRSKDGIDIVTGIKSRVKTRFGQPDWKKELGRVSSMG